MHSNSLDINWPQLVLSETTLTAIDRYCERKCPQPALAQEASVYVLDKLSDNDWALCKRFEGKSKPTTYLYTVINNLINDFIHKKFGKVRPPSWLSRQGALWVDVWKALCVQRHMVPSILARFSMAPERSVALIEEIVSVIKRRIPSCGLPTYAEEVSSEAMEESWPSEDNCSIDNSIDASSQSQAMEETLLLLSELLRESGPGAKERAPALNFSALSRLSEHLSLTDEEQLVLRLFYGEGLKGPAVATALGLASHQPRRILQRTHQKIEQAFKRAGLADFVDNPAQEVNS